MLALEPVHLHDRDGSTRERCAASPPQRRLVEVRPRGVRAGGRRRACSSFSLGMAAVQPSLLGGP